MNTLLQDLRFATRMIFKTPGLTAAAVFLLAIGIGVNLSIFVLTNSLLLRPQPGVASPESLLMLGRTQEGRGFDNFSIPNLVDFRDQSRTLSALAIVDTMSSYGLNADGLTERVEASEVSGNFFDLLGVSTAAGRKFVADDDSPGAPPVAIISYRYWQQRWRGDRSVLGKQILLNGQPFVIVGVAAQGFDGPLLGRSISLYIPIHAVAVFPGGSERLTFRAGSSAMALARSKPGASIEQVRQDLGAIAVRLREQFPRDNEGRGIAVENYHPFGRPSVVRQAWFLNAVLLAASLLVLIVVCANVANLLLARAATRRREAAIRLALGSSRWRLVRQMLLEGVLLAVIALVCGFFAASWSADAIVAFLPNLPEVKLSLNLSLDHRVALYGGLLAFLATLVIAIPAAFFDARQSLAPVIKSGERSSIPGRTWLRSGLTVVQVALCVVLVAAGALMLRTINGLRSIDARMNVDNLLLVSFDPGMMGYTEAQGQLVMDRMLERFRSLPGVQLAAHGTIMPFGMATMGIGPIAGGDVQTPIPIACNFISTDYFRALGIPILQGREFLPSDKSGAPIAAIVNETLAAQFWPGRSPVGQTLKLPVYDNEPRRSATVVGVAMNSRYSEATTPDRPFYYLPNAQNYRSRATFLLRTSVPPLSLLETVRKAALGVDPALPLYAPTTMSSFMQNSFWPQKLVATLVGIFAVLTIGLAAVGLYASLSFHVAQRTREFGIRMALGATSRLILRDVLRGAIVLTSIGLVLGTVLALAVTRLMGWLLYGIQPHDPITYACVLALLLAVAAFAAWLPARRATRVDPLVALRYE